MNAYQVLYLSEKGAQLQHHRLIIAAIACGNMHPTLAVKSMQSHDSSRLLTRCCFIGFIAGVCLCQSWPTFRPWIPVGAGERALQTPLSHSTAQQPSTACLNAKRVAGAPPSALLQFTCEFTTSAGQITSQLSASDRFRAAAAPPPHCVAQRVGQPQIRRSLSLSSTVSPTKRYLCL